MYSFIYFRVFLPHSLPPQPSHVLCINYASKTFVTLFPCNGALVIQVAVQLHLLSSPIMYRCYLLNCRSRIVRFVLTCVLLPSPAVHSWISKKIFSLFSMSLLVQFLKKRRLTHMSNRQEIDCVEGGGWVGVLVSPMPVLMTSILHWKWHTDAFKLMWLPSTFHFFYLSPPLPSGFLIFPGPSLWLPPILETDAP